MASASPATPGAAAPPPSCLHLTLQQDPATQGWQADLQARGATLHFDSVPALIAWLARLEPLPPGRGIR